MRVLLTAFPTLPETTTPSREGLPVSAGSQFAIMHPCTRRFPCSRSFEKSRPCLMRWWRANPRRFGDSAAMRQIDQTGVRRLRPLRRRLRRVALPLLLELRFRKPCCRLRRIFDGWYCRFIKSVQISCQRHGVHRRFPKERGKIAVEEGVSRQRRQPGYLESEAVAGYKPCFSQLRL